MSRPKEVWVIRNPKEDSDGYYYPGASRFFVPEQAKALRFNSFAEAATEYARIRKDLGLYNTRIVRLKLRPKCPSCGQAVRKCPSCGQAVRK